MLRRLITEERLNDGLGTDDNAKHGVLASEAPFIQDVACDDRTANVARIGHLTGCSFRNDGYQNQSIGSFYIDMESLTKDQRKTLVKKLDAKETWSFLGNISQGVVKPWKKKTFKLFRFEPGLVSKQKMVSNQRHDAWVGFGIISVIVLICLFMSAGALFFPNVQMNGSRIGRICLIVLLAVAADFIGFLLSQLLGGMGVALTLLLVIGLLYVGCSEELSGNIRLPSLPSDASGISYTSATGASVTTQPEPEEERVPLLDNVPRSSAATGKLDHDLVMVVAIGVLTGLVVLWVYVGLALLIPEGIRMG